MEKHGEINPGFTPVIDQEEINPVADSLKPIKMAEDDRLKAIRELDGDFRKLAADAAKKAL